MTNTRLEVNGKANPATTGLTAADAFYCASVTANSGIGDTTALSHDDTSDFTATGNSIIGITTPVWHVMDYTKDFKVDASDGTTNTNNIHDIANPIGPFAPDAGSSAAPAAAPQPTDCHDPREHHAPRKVPTTIGRRSAMPSIK